MAQLTLHQGNNLPILQSMTELVDLIYIDPPFNTGKKQVKNTLKMTASGQATRQGYGGKTYDVESVSKMQYEDEFDDYLSFIVPRIKESYRLLKENGSFMIHLDWREVHYVKIECDKIFGRQNFINEIIWAYDYGARSKKKWSTKHDTILWYAKDAENYTFNYDAIDRIPYMAPSLVGPEKAEIGKTPTDVHWVTIVPTNGKEKTGYPTQKPMKLLERLILVHSNPGDTVMDFFAGSGTTGEAALKNGRNAILIDENQEAMDVINKRLASYTTPIVEAK